MPRVHSSMRQKNKPFKNKKPKAAKTTTSKTKPITKACTQRIKHNKNQRLQNNKLKKERQVQKLTHQNQYLDTNTKELVTHKLKNQTSVKIVVLVPGNAEANPILIRNKIIEIIDKFEGNVRAIELPAIPYPVVEIIPSSKSFLKNKLLIISAVRHQQQQIDMLTLHQLLKCADVICPVLSCSKTNTQGINLNPHEEGKAFDSTGYLILNMIRSMGVPTTIGIVQDLLQHKPKHHDKIERLFKRFISSELSENDKITYIKGDQDYQKLLRQMDTVSLSSQPWKSQRGYMLIQNYTINSENSVTFHGYLKGNCINANQLVHVSGFEDYALEKVEIENSRKMDEEEHLIQYTVNPEQLFPFSKKQEQTEDLLNALEGLKLEKKEEMEEENESDYEDQSDSEGDADMEEYFGNKEEEKAKRIEMQMRKEDELQFQDEVEYATEEKLRQKFSEYQGLKNFKTSQWNSLENLPDIYDQIYTFKNYQRTAKVIQEQTLSQAFAYPGFYISVTVAGFPSHKLEGHRSPLILTFLLKHEHKMTQIHAKVRRNPHYPANDTVINSNELYLVSMGFRSFITRPIFSRVINGSDKTKFIKKIEEDYESYFYCSFYSYNYFPPAPIHIFRINQFNTAEHELSPVMYGELAKCDPLHIILERIILTGYPHKINRRRATVRFMFFNPKDVKYFKPIEVRTKGGKKGRIEESLGMHGFMKVLFNDKVSQNDTVCMNLYRRVYPQPYF